MGVFFITNTTFSAETSTENLLLEIPKEISVEKSPNDFILMSYEDSGCSTTTLYDHYNTTYDNVYSDLNYGSAGNGSAGQYWTATSTYTLFATKLHLNKSASMSGTFYCAIYNADASGFPTGEALASTTNDGSEFVIDPDHEWETMIFNDGVEIIAGNKYAIATGWTNNQPVYVFHKNSGNSYTNGAMIYSSNNWTSWTESADKDILFETWGCVPATSTPNATATAISSEINDVRIYPFIFFGTIIIFLMGFWIILKS